MKDPTQPKYTTTEVAEFDGVSLHRIRAARNFYALKPYDPEAEPDEFDFRLIEEGTLGGWIQSEDNLSHDGFAWVDGNAQVFGDARVSEGALIYGNAKVHDGVIVKGCAKIYDEAQVSGDTMVSGRAKIYDRAHVCTGDIHGDAEVSGYTFLQGEGEIIVHGYSQISGHAKLYSKVSGSIEISGHAQISDEAETRSDGDYTNITDCASVFDKAKILNASTICGHAQVYGMAQIDGGHICQNAIVCGETYVPAGTYIGGHARVELVRGDSYTQSIYLHPGAYLVGNTVIDDQSDYMIIGPLKYDKEPSPTRLVFTLDEHWKPMMVMIKCVEGGQAWIEKKIFPIDDTKELKRLLGEVKTQHRDEKPKPLQTELVDMIISIAEQARIYLSHRVKQIAETTD